MLVCYFRWEVWICGDCRMGWLDYDNWIECVERDCWNVYKVKIRLLVYVN